MQYKYYRFYLLSSRKYDFIDLNDSTSRDTEQSKSALNIIRLSYDTQSEDKSISILCHSDADSIEEQDQLAQFLLQHNVPISSKIEHEILEDTELDSHQSCHNEDSKDNTSNHHHDHCHDHAHHHEHNHCHNHTEHAKDEGDKKEHTHEHCHENSGHTHIHDRHWLKAGIGLVFGIGLLALSFFTLNIPLIAYYIITGLSSIVTLFLGYKVYQAAFDAIRKQKWDMATLYTISTLSIIGISIASIFIPGLPLMLESAPLILGFWHLGEAIEHSLINEINSNLDVRTSAPSFVVLKGNPDQTVPVSRIIPNDIIKVKGGDVIALDGVLLQPAQIYKTCDNGTPFSSRLEAGAKIKAGMRLSENMSEIEIRVNQTYQNSYLSLLAKSINNAHKEKAPIEEFANKILKYFVPTLLIISVISGITIGLLFPPALAIQCVVSVLVSACPCALSLITPLAVKIGMRKSAEKRVHFKDGKTLQATADIDTIVFDLNGTLTQGKPAIEHINVDDEELYDHVALLESKSGNSIAKKIQEYLNHHHYITNTSLDLTAVDDSHHSGIKGTINGESFIIGSVDILHANGITYIKAPYNNPDNGNIYIARNSQVVGQIALFDPLRHEAATTINRLKALGKNIHMCTGADKITAQRFAALIGIPQDNICAGVAGVSNLPEETSKVSYIKQLKAKGCKVAMVGDSINDVGAVGNADIGIAIKSNIGSIHTQNEAKIIIEDDLLFPVVTAFDVAKKTKQNIYQNLFISLTYNTTVTLIAAGLFIALGFALNPTIGIVLMILESVVILSNLYRLKQQSTVCLESNMQHAANDEPSVTTTAQILNSLDCAHTTDLSKEKGATTIDSPAKVSPHTISHSDNKVGLFSRHNLSDPDYTSTSNQTLSVNP